MAAQARIAAVAEPRLLSSREAAEQRLLDELGPARVLKLAAVFVALRRGRGGRIELCIDVPHGDVAP